MAPWAFLAVLAAAGPHAEGWWPPDGPSLHPSGLPAGVRDRIAAAALELRPPASASFLGRSGLIVTSARAVEACARAAGLGSAPQVYRIPATAPACSELEPAMRLDLRDVTEALDASRSAGTRDVERAVVSACETSRPSRRCRLLEREGRHLLEIRHRFALPRLRYWPGTNGGIALLSVDSARGGPSGWLSPSRERGCPERAFVVHHPSPSLRGASVLELELYLQALASNHERSEVERVLWQDRAELLDGARRRELESFHRVRQFPLPRVRALEAAFTVGRTARRAAGFELAPARLSEEEVGLALRYQEARARRLEAYRLGGVAPVGPDGQGDVRISRAFLREAGPDLCTYAADVGPGASGGPVLDAEGRMLGVLDGGGPNTARGAVRYVPGAQVRVLRLSTLATALGDSDAPELARALR